MTWEQRLTPEEKEAVDALIDAGFSSKRIREVLRSEGVAVMDHALNNYKARRRPARGAHGAN